MNFELPYLSGIQYESVADGFGVRTAIYLSGCSHQCPGCHNEEAQSPTNGQQITEELIATIAEEINKRPFLNGITLTGGDPLYDPYRTLKFLSELWKKLDNSKQSLWLYTGYTYDEVIALTHENMAANVIINAYTDVLVDGRFDLSKSDKTLAFRGSSNQRIIDIGLSVRFGRPIEYSVP